MLVVVYFYILIPFFLVINKCVVLFTFVFIFLISLLIDVSNLFLFILKLSIQCGSVSSQIGLKNYNPACSGVNVIIFRWRYSGG